MNSKLRIALCAAALTAAAGAPLGAAESETPIVRFTTSVYDANGAANAISFAIGGTGGGYIDVDCGFGPVEYELADAVFDPETQSIQATNVSCTVSDKGVVEIYGDAEAIEYLDLSGCYMRTIEMPGLKNLQILYMERNELTGLDLTPFSKLQAVYVSGNPYSAATPLIIGPNKPDLTILEIGKSEYLDTAFDLSDYPSMMSFNAFHCDGLTKLDPTGCPRLMQLSADLTPIESIDVTKNPELVILNVSDTRITSLDVSKNPKLRELYVYHSAAAYGNYKMRSLDVSNNPELVYLFAGYNDIESLDLSKNPKLFELSLPYNNLTTLDVSQNPELYSVNLRSNYFGFATLPLDPGTWNEYYYDQRPNPVAREYKVGDVIDFNATMMREGTTTHATLYRVNEDDFSLPIPVDPSAYSFENGMLTLKEVQPDSVFVTFENNILDQYTISTSNFVVKTEADFGKPTVSVSMLPGTATGETLAFTVGLDGATPESPRSFSVDFGDGKEVEFTATGSTPAEGCRVQGKRAGSGYVKVIVPEGESVTALAIDGVQLYSLDLSKARCLRQLWLTGTGLYQLDLSELRCLQSIRLTGNNLYTLSIAGKNRYFFKTALTELWAPSNGIATFEEDGLEGLESIDLSDNQLESFFFDTATRATTINLSDNHLGEAILKKCDGLKHADLSGNRLSEIILPELSTLESLNISGNAFTLATLPDPSLISGTYTYTSQAPITIPVKGPGADLASQYRVIGDTSTEYAWFKADGSRLAEGTDYSISGGKTRFLDSSLGMVYCLLTHPAYPELSIAEGTALRTTELEVAAMPTNVIASFVTPKGGEKVLLSLAAVQAGTTIFIDWKGDGIDLESYELGDSYRTFEATTTAGADVKVYTYTDGAPISVFSISGATISSIDLSKLSSMMALTLSGAGLSEITLPGYGKLRELNLERCAFTELDLSKEPDIVALSLTGNKFSGTFDLSPLKKLQQVSLADNELTGLTIANEELWFLDLSGNRFATVDLSGAPRLEQLGLSNNDLATIDVASLSALKALALDGNRFTFTTLPPVKGSYIVYSYGNQAPVKAIVDGLSVDLSSQAFVGETPTTYRWFIDMPVYNRETELWEGEELETNEYTLEGGVSTFEVALDRLVCLMNNSQFPRLNLFSEMCDLSGVESVTADGTACRIYVVGADIVVDTDSATSAMVFTTAGRLVRTAALQPGANTISGLAPGIYIVRAGAVTAKVAVY